MQDVTFRLSVAIAAAIAMVIAIYMRFFLAAPELPKKPPRPTLRVSNPTAIAKSAALSSQAYEHFLDEDAQSFGIGRASVANMSAAFKHERSDATTTLAPGDSFEFGDLRLQLRIEKHGRPHLVLEIENAGNHFLAYRVVTRPSSGLSSCVRMSQLPHNTLALRPRSSVRRTECTYRKGMALELVSIETLKIPEQGYYYLSSADASGLAVDARFAAKHEKPARSLACTFRFPTKLRKAIERERIGWLDQVDFYARHRCLSYGIFEGYEAFQRDGERILPASEGDPR